LRYRRTVRNAFRSFVFGSEVGLYTVFVSYNRFAIGKNGPRTFVVLHDRPTRVVKRLFPKRNAVVFSVVTTQIRFASVFDISSRDYTKTLASCVFNVAPLDVSIRPGQTNIVCRPNRPRYYRKLSSRQVIRRNRVRQQCLLLYGLNTDRPAELSRIVLPP